MPVTKREEVTKQGFCKILGRTLRLRGSLLLVLIQFLGGVRGKGVDKLSVNNFKGSAQLTQFSIAEHKLYRAVSWLSLIHI